MADSVQKRECRRVKLLVYAPGCQTVARLVGMFYTIPNDGETKDVLCRT